MRLGHISGYYILKRDMLLYEELGKHDIQVTVFSNRDFKNVGNINLPIVKLWRWGQFNRIPILNKGIQYFFPYDRWLFGLKKAVKEMDVLNPWEIFNAFSYGAVKTGKPTVITVIDNIPFNYRFAYKKIVNGVKKGALHFIAGTNTSKFMLELEGINENKISVIPLAIDIDKFKPLKKNYGLVRKYKIDEKKFIILFVGRVIDEQKGISDLIYAFYKIAKTRKDAVLLIGGVGPDIEKMKRLVRQMGIEDRVFFLGYLPDEGLADYYNLCDVFCGPSRFTRVWQEQFGYTMVEAMGCGKPVISTFSGSIADVVINGKTGLLVGANNSYSLYEALLTLINRKDLREDMSKNAREWVAKNFDIKLVAKKLATLYKNLL